jgi:PHD/YefM family antitoxin component YafN of YafNO toxin-antitoxin module
MDEVVSTSEARAALHRIAQGFDAGDTHPVYFGSHRRAQAVIVPVGVWEQLLEQAEDDLDLATARDRLTGDNSDRLSHDTVTTLIERLRGRAPRG